MTYCFVSKVLTTNATYGKMVILEFQIGHNPKEMAGKKIQLEI